MASIDEALKAAKNATYSNTNAASATQKILRKGATQDVRPRDRIAEEYYDAITVGDISSVQIPIVYGEIYHKGVVVDSGSVQNIEDDRFNDRTVRFVMGEGPCEGIPSTKTNHVVLDDIPLVNPANQEITYGGVKIKDITTRTTYTEQTTAASYDIENSILTGSGKIHSRLLKNSIAGLDDVAVDQQLRKGHILFYNDDTERWQSVHLNELLADAGLYISEDISPVETTYPQSAWWLPHTQSIEVTWNLNDTYKQRTDDDGPERWWRSNIGDDWYNTDDDQQYIHSPKLNGVKHPEVVVYRGVTYEISAGSDFLASFTSGSTYDTKFYIARHPVNDVDPDGTYAMSYTSGMEVGTLHSITISNTPSGYVAGEAPAVSITQASGDTSGTGAAATAVWDAGSSQMIITISNTGSAYTLPPDITIEAPDAGGTTATATSKITDNYTDAGRTIKWTVPTTAPDWLWYGINLVFSWSSFTGGRIMVRDI